jgi:hypothetical protein
MFGGMNGGNMADMMGEEDAEFMRDMGAGSTETSSKPAEPPKPPQPDPKANLSETQKQVIKILISYLIRNQLTNFFN